MDIKPDYSPINADWCGLKSLSRKQRRRVNKPGKRDLKDIFDRLLEGFTYQLALTKDTAVGELRGRVIGFLNGKQWNIDVQEMQSVSLASSWSHTKHWNARKNIQKCKEWCRSPLLDSPLVMPYLAVEVTLEGMGTIDWAKEVLFNRRGLKTHGRRSKTLLKEWIRHDTDSQLLRRVSIVSVDFASRGVCRAIAGLNFGSS